MNNGSSKNGKRVQQRRLRGQSDDVAQINRSGSWTRTVALRLDLIIDCQQEGVRSGEKRQRTKYRELAVG